MHRGRQSDVVPIGNGQQREWLGDRVQRLTQWRSSFPAAGHRVPARWMVVFVHSHHRWQRHVLFLSLLFPLDLVPELELETLLILLNQALLEILVGGSGAVGRPQLTNRHHGHSHCRQLRNERVPHRVESGRRLHPAEIRSAPVIAIEVILPDALLLEPDVFSLNHHHIRPGLQPGDILLDWTVFVRRRPIDIAQNAVNLINAHKTHNRLHDVHWLDKTDSTNQYQR